MHERGLHVDAEHDAKPDQIYAKMLRRRTEQRYDDEGQFEKVEEEGQHKHESIDEQQKANLSPRQRGEQTFGPDVPADAIESQREHTGAEQDENYEYRQFSRE